MRTIDSVSKQIDARISINAGRTSTRSNSMFDDDVEIDVYDTTSGVNFLEIHMSREQFINAVMNRLGHTELKQAIVTDLHKVGKTREGKVFEFEIPEENRYGKEKEFAVKMVKELCPDGWIPEVGFSSQDSFFYGKDGKRYARTKIMRWVDKNDITKS